MADNFLSQDEVDALLKGVTGETDDAPAEAEDHSGARPYNLATQERIVRGRMPTLEIINERFARQLRIGLYNFLRRGVEISVGPVRVSKYSEFIRNLVVPTNLNLVLGKPLRGTGLVVFDPNYRGKISVKTQHMNLDYSAFEGWKIEGRPSHVTVRGQVAVRNGKFVGKHGHGKFLPRQPGHF